MKAYSMGVRELMRAEEGGPASAKDRPSAKTLSGAERELLDLLEKIRPADEDAAGRARKHWDGIAKPLGSLGLLEDALVRIAALTGSEKLDIGTRALLVFCADNGVVRQGVTQCGGEVTASVAVALAEGRSSVSPMARLARCMVLPVDVGIADFPGNPGVLSRRIRNGTADISMGAAMEREECVQAILAGVSTGRERIAQGARLLAAGEMGIGNTTTGSAVASVLLGIAPDRLIGRGAGLSDAGLARKREAVLAAIQTNAPDPADPVAVMASVGGLDIAAMCGLFLAGAAYRTPVLIDGMISAVAALCAARICPEARVAMLASHVSAEPAGMLLLHALSLQPLITAGMRLGEGSGAVMAMPLLDMAMSIYDSGQTFSRLGIAAYTPQ